MISRRDKLLVNPWEQRRYEQHREKVNSAKAVVDRSPPTFYPHIIQKAKKQQSERERIFHIENENVRLLQRLADIMRTKRMPDFWRDPRPKEKLFEVRPYTTHTNWSPSENLKDTVQKAVKEVRSNRCPTCKGEPEKPKINIPEERIPWQPPRLSFNVKSLRKCPF